MNVLIDIGHPAHVHVFRNYFLAMSDLGHSVHFTCRDKDCTIDLLEHYGMPYNNIGKPYSGAISKLFGMILFGLKIRKIAKEQQSDLFVSISSMYAAQCAWFLGKPHIVLDDTEHSRFEHMLYKPFSTMILTPSCFEKHMGKKHVRYDGFHELAYLHPLRFKPDPSIREAIGIDSDRPFVLLRFVSWNAGHDRGQSGLNANEKEALIASLETKCQVFISSENALPPSLEKYRIRIPAHQMHSVLNEAVLYIGEGATMASECAMLGTPAIYVNTLTAGTLREQGSYGLIHSFPNGNGVIDEALMIISDPQRQAMYKSHCAMMLNEKIDVTRMLIDVSLAYDSRSNVPLTLRFTKMNVAG